MLKQPLENSEIVVCKLMMKGVKAEVGHLEDLTLRIADEFKVAAGIVSSTTVELNPLDPQAFNASGKSPSETATALFVRGQKGRRRWKSRISKEFEEVLGTNMKLDHTPATLESVRQLQQGSPRQSQRSPEQRQRSPEQTQRSPEQTQLSPEQKALMPAIFSPLADA